MAERLVGKRYQIIEELGAGSMGKVFPAQDRLTGQLVAVKQVNVPAAQLEHESRASHSDPRMALAQEFRILASLRHPNNISVLDYGFDEDRQPYATMELLDHAVTIFDAGKNQPLEANLDLLIQILQALMYLHRRGVLHRDLKASNVLVVNDVVKLLDFGLSIMSEQSTSGEIAGTPNYMAPELWLGKSSTKGSDLYAVDVVGYRLIAGRMPFDSSSIHQLYHEVQTIVPDLDALGDNAVIKFVIGRLLEKTPEDCLPDASRESFLQAAAVAGRQLDLDVLREVQDADMLPLLDHWLSDCADAAVLEVQEGQWLFAHNKLRGGVLAEIDPAALTDLHRQIALGNESVYQYSSRHTAAVLEYHWRRAYDVEREEQLRRPRAGEQALHSGAYAVAQGFLLRALDLQDSVEGSKRKTALLVQQLGDAAVELQQFDEAKCRYQESLEICRTISYRCGQATNPNRLGMIAAAAQDYQIAATSLTEALRIAMDVRALAVAVNTLAAMAELLVQSGDPVTALEFAVLAFNHPACDGQTHYLADHLIDELQAHLSPEIFATVERGRTRELKEVAATSAQRLKRRHRGRL